MTSPASASTTFLVELNANGGVIGYYELETCYNGRIDSLPTPVKENHVFNGWFTLPEGGAVVCENFVFGANDRIYAQWITPEEAMMTTSSPVTGQPPTTADDARVPLNAVNQPPSNSSSGGIIPEITIGGMLLFSPFGAAAWSLANFVIAIFGILFVLAAVAKALLQKKREFSDEDNELSYSEEISLENKKKVMWLPVSFVAGILSLFLFLIMQDRSQAMVLTDFWTLAHVLLLTTEISAVVLAFKKSKKPVSSMREIEKNALPIC